MHMEFIYLDLDVFDQFCNFSHVDLAHIRFISISFLLLMYYKVFCF